MDLFLIVGMADHESGKVYMHAVGMARGCVCMGLFHVEYVEGWLLMH